MSLFDRFNHSNPSPNPKWNPLKPFLTPLNLKFPSSSSLSHLSDCINLLAGSISSASIPSDSSSRDAYLDSTISILDTCNSISAQIEWLRFIRLRLKFALQMLISSPERGAKLLSELETPFCDEIPTFGCFEEIEKVERAVKGLKKAIERGEEMKAIVTESGIVSEEMIMGLDCLASAVSGLFSEVLHSRNAVLDSYRVGPKRCK